MIARKPYDPKNWYWMVADDDTKAFSSAVGDYVLANNAEFLAWQFDGTRPTRIANEAELGAVLAQYSIRPAAANVLAGYLESQATKIAVHVVATVLFNHENRIRALAGQQQISAAQFKNAIKSLV